MSITALLTRTRHLDYCTLGRMAVGERSWPTIERPWIAGDIIGRSCVPTGRYRLERHNSEAHPNTWALVNPALGVWHQPQDIPNGIAGGRCSILVHPANWAYELLGCIAPGKDHVQTKGLWGVTRSRDAMNEVTQVLKVSYDLYIEISDKLDSSAEAIT